jgi:hypothetical protein
MQVPCLQRTPGNIGDYPDYPDREYSPAAIFPLLLPIAAVEGSHESSMGFE